MKNNILLFIILLFLLSCTQKKDGNTKSPTAATKSNNQSPASIKKAKDSTILIDLYLLSYDYLRKKDSIKFRQVNKDVANLAIKIKDSSILASSYWDLAYHLNQKSKIDSSYYYYINAQKIFEKLKDTQKEGKLYYSIALLQSKAKDYRGSEISTIKAIELISETENPQASLFRYYNNLGSVTNALKEYDRAITYYTKALEYQKKIEKANTNDLYILNNLGNVNRDKKDYNEAIRHYSTVLEVDSLKQKDPKFYAKVLDNLAYTQFKKGDTESVEFHLLKALQIRDSLNDNSGLSISHFNLAEYYLFKKDTVKSLHSAKLSEEYSKNDNNYKRLLQTYDILTNIDPKKASIYAHKYIVLNDSLVNEERSLQEKFTRIKFETEEVIGEKEVLEKQKEVLISFIIAALLLAFAVFVIGSQYMKNQKLKFEQEQQEINLETFNLMLAQKGKLARVKQEVQERISQELHDGVIGTLTGIALILKATNKKADEKTVAERIDLIKRIQETSEEIRTISHTLSAASSEKIQNFINSIQELLTNTSKASNIKTKLTYDSKIEWDLLNAEIKINLYRIIQEGVQNCVKYSSAKNIFLHFGIDKSNLSVILSDNGKGFNVKKKKRGIGLKNIHSRVSKMNADINISSDIGKGTEIHITIPLHKDQLLINNQA